MNTDTERANASATALMNTRGVEPAVLLSVTDGGGSYSFRLNHDFGYNRDPASNEPYRWVAPDLPELTADGEPVGFRISPDGQRLMLFEESLLDEDPGRALLILQLTDDDELVTVSVNRKLDHTGPDFDDILSLSFPFIATDNEGREEKAWVDINVVDVAPPTYSGYNGIDTPSSVVPGNFVVDRWRMDAGKEGLDRVFVSLPGDDTEYPLGAMIDTDKGLLAVNLEYWVFKADPDAEGSFEFQIVVIDGDGDRVNIEAHFDIRECENSEVATTPETDGDPTTEPAHAIVDEAASYYGSASGSGTGETVVAAGSLGYDLGSDCSEETGYEIQRVSSFDWDIASLPRLTADGYPVSWLIDASSHRVRGVAYDSDAQEEYAVIEVVLTDLASGSYEVRLPDVRHFADRDQIAALDHSGAGNDDSIHFELGYVVVDVSGNSAFGVLEVTVNDDAPRANDDRASTSKDTQVIVDVLANDVLGADGSGGVVAASVQGGADVGSVTVRGDGRLSFVPHPDFLGDALIDYTSSDGDGDTTQGGLTVNVRDAASTTRSTPETDDDPDTQPARVVVDEEGLPGGIAGGIGDIAGESTVATGFLGYDAGDDGVAGFSWIRSSYLVDVEVRGEVPRLSLVNNGRTLIAKDAQFGSVFRLELVDITTGEYRFELFQPLDHSDPSIEDNVDFVIDYVVTDGDGDTAEGVLEIRVNDDAGRANSDSAATLSATPVIVDVLSNDEIGAEGVRKVMQASVQGGDAVGTVSINPDGTLTFVPAVGFSGDALIDYARSDGDGDFPVGTLTVSVAAVNPDGLITPLTDGDPDTRSPKAVVDQDGLAGGIAGGAGDTATQSRVTIGSLGYDFGNDGPGGFRWHTDGLPILTSGGDPVSWRLSGNGRSLLGVDSGGGRVIAVQLVDVVTGRYKVTLDKPLDHVISGIEDDLSIEVGYTVTDGGGDVAAGRLDIVVDDDSLVARDDSATIAVDTAIRVAVLDNDGLGADGPGGIIDASVRGGPAVGSVTINPDNSLTFVPHPELFGREVLIDYVVSDADGDTAAATLSVVVEGGDAGGPTTPDSDGDPENVAPTAIVDEDRLYLYAYEMTGLEGGSGDIGYYQAYYDGFLGYDFGEAGPGSFRWSTDGLPELSANGEPVTWSLNAAGNSLIGKARGLNIFGYYDQVDVISIKLLGLEPGIFKVELLKGLDHSDPYLEDDITFSVGYVITDGNGDSAQGSLDILVDDDSPRGGGYRGWYFTGTDTPVRFDLRDDILIGADFERVANFRAEVVGGDSVGQVSHEEGDFYATFTPHPEFHGKALLQLGYTDGDGDETGGRVEVSVGASGNNVPITPLSDGDPATVSARAVLDEEGLAGGIAGGPGDVAGEARVVTGSLGNDFGKDGPWLFPFHWVTDGLPALSSQGSPLSWLVNGTGHEVTGVDALGNEVISVRITDLEQGLYRVELHRPLDHDDASLEDNIDLTVRYMITDGNGDTAQGQLRISVDDDSMLLVDDSTTTDKASPISVDVLANDQYGADGLGGLVSASVRGGAAVGNVTINPDDTLTFVAHPDFFGKALIAYTASDADGDIRSAELSVMVENDAPGTPTTPETDGDPLTNPAKAVVDEDGLAGGIHGGVRDAPTELTVATGVLGYDFGSDGQGDFRWSTDGLPSLTSGGDPVTWRLNGNGRSLVGFDSNGDRAISVQLVDQATGSYKVAVARPLDHANARVEDDLNFVVGYSVSDADGDTAEGVLRVTVDDDRGRANDDSARTDRATAVDVDVLANDDHGADGPGRVIAASVQGGADVGSVTLTSAGVLTFVPQASFSGTALIDYTGSDADGDITAGQLSVSVDQGTDRPTTPETDDDPATGPATAVVDEDGLAGGVAGGPGDAPGELTVVTGSLGYDFGSDGRGTFRWSTDGLPSLTSQGRPLSWSLNATGHTMTASDTEGNDVLRVRIIDILNAEYRVSLLRPLDHDDAMSEDSIDMALGYVITDRDGEAAQGVLNVSVNDDSVRANDDSVSTVSGDRVRVDVLANDEFGADGPGRLVGARIQGGADGVGTLKIHPNSTLTFESDSSFSGVARVHYDAMDGDGDISTGTLVVDVETDDIPTTPETDDDPNTVPVRTFVDEDGLPGGIPGGDGDVATERTVATGLVGYNFGNNGQGGFTWHSDDLPTLTTGGDPVTWQLSGNGRSLLGVDSSGDRVISVQLTDVASGSYRVALFQPLDHEPSPSLSYVVEDNRALEVGYTVTDRDGDRAEGVFLLFVDDDAGSASDDSASTDSDTPITVDVSTNDKYGADGPGSIGGFGLQGGAGVGSITVNADDTVTFIPNPSFSGVAEIDYSSSDNDGDSSEATLSIDVTGGDPTRPTTPETDGDPATMVAEAVVDEDGLGGNPGGFNDVPGEQTVVTGSLGYDFGEGGRGSFRWTTEGMPSLTSQGRPLAWSLGSSGHSLLASDSDGNTVIGIEMTDIDSGDYRVELYRPLDHKDDLGESDINVAVGYVITDGDGDTAEGQLRLTVDDDTPVITADLEGFTFYSGIPVTLDLVNFGGDGYGSLKVRVSSGDGGQVTINPDHTVTFLYDGGFISETSLWVDAADSEYDEARSFARANVAPAPADADVSASAIGDTGVLVTGEEVAAQAGRLALSELLDESDEEVAAWLPPDQTDSVGPASAGGSGGGSGGSSDSGADSEQTLALNGAGVPGAGDTTLERIGQEAALLVE